jgi:uncharacterized protein
MPYGRRCIDDELDDLFRHLAAIAIEGPKGVGKTTTASQRAASIIELDRPEQTQLLDADPARLERLPKPVLIDEWQRHPRVWDLVRRRVDADAAGGQYLLAGSATPTDAPAHSGAGRIVRIRMRPLSLFERNLAAPTVQLGRMLSSNALSSDADSARLPTQPVIQGSSNVALTDYVREIVASGFPGIRDLPARARQAQLRSYIDRIADVEFVEQGHRVAKPAALRSWIEAWESPKLRCWQQNQTATGHSSAMDFCSGSFLNRWSPSRCVSTHSTTRPRSLTCEQRTETTKSTSSSKAPTAGLWPSK